MTILNIPTFRLGRYSYRTPSYDANTFVQISNIREEINLDIINIIADIPVSNNDVITVVAQTDDKIISSHKDLIDQVRLLVRESYLRINDTRPELELHPLSELQVTYIRFDHENQSIRPQIELLTRSSNTVSTLH